MADVPMRIYLLTHLVPTTKTVMWYGLIEGRCDPGASEVSRNFARWLLTEIVPYGQAFDCGREYTEQGIEAQAIVSLHTPWPALAEQPGVTIREARGEIVVGHNCIYYAGQDSLFILENEVLFALFAEDNGVAAPDLDAGITDRLRRWATAELRGLGYTPEAIDEIARRFLDHAWGTPPKDWSWKALTQLLHRLTNDYCEEPREAPQRWYVYERLQHGDDIVPSILSGALVDDVVGAASDEPGEARQWLVSVRPLLGAWRMSDPENESLRPLDDFEIFASHRGVVWVREGEPVWLGELAGDHYHDRHGEIVGDLEERARELVVEAMIEQAMLRLSPDDDMLEHLVQHIHDTVDETDLLSLWIHDLDVLVERAVERAEVSGL